MTKRVFASVVVVTLTGAACGSISIVTTTGTTPLAKCKSIPHQVAEVRGTATFAGAPDPDVTLTLFNGFETEETKTERDGSYCLPLIRSTDGKLVSLFTTKDGADPVAQKLTVTTKAPPGKVAIMTAKPVDLSAAADPSAATVIGIAYVRADGGRPFRHSGIEEFEPALDVKFTGPSQKTATTDAEGLFLTAVQSGTYRLVTARNIVVDNVMVSPGKTTIVPVIAGERRYF